MVCGSIIQYPWWSLYKRYPWAESLCKYVMETQSQLSIMGMSKVGTCAIVGNAGHLTQKNYGQAIDQHDLVVCVAPLRRKFEADGCKLCSVLLGVLLRSYFDPGTCGAATGSAQP